MEIILTIMMKNVKFKKIEDFEKIEDIDERKLLIGQLFYEIKSTFICALKLKEGIVVDCSKIPKKLLPDPLMLAYMAPFSYNSVLIDCKMGCAAKMGDSKSLIKSCFQVLIGC